MDTQTREKIEAYLKNQLDQAGNRLRANTVDGSGRKYFKRNAAVSLQGHLKRFQRTGQGTRWVSVAGLRGVGKTTLLAQIFTELSCTQNHKLYISLDETERLLGVGLQDVLSVYETMLGQPFEELSEHLFLFIDEIQYDKSWASVLKSLYDRSKKIFIFCTGSSALLLQSNSDTSRRLLVEKLYPLSFPEFLMLQHGKYPKKGLGAAVREALFESADAEEAAKKLASKQLDVARYYKGVDKKELDYYLRVGSLPFALAIQREVHIYQTIDQTLTNIVTKDIPSLQKFDAQTLTLIPQLLYTVANNSITSLTNVSKTFKKSINTVVDIFAILERCELLQRIYPYGTHLGQVKKPSKYLFTSSAYRSMFFNQLGSTASYDQYKGFLVEDALGLSLTRYFGLTYGSNLTYDSSQGGADFIVSKNGVRIAIEVSYGRKRAGQVELTMKNTKCRYGIVFASRSSIALNKDKTVVFVPLAMALLV